VLVTYPVEVRALVFLAVSSGKHFLQCPESGAKSYLPRCIEMLVRQTSSAFFYQFLRSYYSIWT
jgi:hypothetical protein